MGDNQRKIVGFIGKHPSLTIIGLFILVTIAVELRGGDYKQVIPFEDVTPEAVTSTLAVLLLVSLFIERLIEVVVSNARKEKRIPLENEVRAKQSDKKEGELRLEELRKNFEIAAPENQDNIAEQMNKVRNRLGSGLQSQGSLEASLNRAQDALQVYRGETRRLAMVTSIFLGLFAAFAGVRGLAPFVSEPLSELGSIAVWFHSVDVILTAALLGGGSGGIHALTSAFGKMVKPS